MDMVHGKCKFLNSFLIFSDTLVGTYSLLRLVLCFTTKRFEHKLTKKLANFITYFVNMCNIYEVKSWSKSVSGQWGYFKWEGRRKL